MKQATPSKAETILLDPFVGLPLECIIVPATKEHFAFAAAEIKVSGVVGFDTESKPTFAKGDVSAGPHVVQFATREKAFIFQLCKPDCRENLINILQSEDILKVGFGLESDRDQIQRKLGVQLGAVLDLNTVFRKEGYRHTAGVRAAVAIVLNQKFHKSKRVTTSNWAMPELTSRQLLYAANDAFAAFKVMEALN
ncbi:MAG: 3'-5' exonuclease, partial [Pseudomonadota bacterium]